MILKNGKRIDTCSDTVPIGTLNPYLGSTAPYGYLICAGQLVSKTTYPELYSICGSIFGTETADEFYLPDLRGQTIAGYKENDSVFGTLGGLVGSLAHTHTTQAHTLTVDEMPEHNHAKAANVYNPNGTGWYYIGYLGVSAGTTKQTELYGNSDKNTGGNQSHEHGDTGSTSSVQPTMTLNWIVKAFQLMPNQSHVATTQQTSDIDTYSCNYVNNALATKMGIPAVGTWTPTIENINSNNPTVTYIGQKGWYYILGNMAFISGYARFKITALNANGDYAVIRGIPNEIMSHATQTLVGNIGFSTGVIYDCVVQSTDLCYVLDAGSGNGVRIQQTNGSSATTWKVTSGNYAEVGFSGIIFLDD